MGSSCRVSSPRMVDSQPLSAGAVGTNTCLCWKQRQGGCCIFCSVFISLQQLHRGVKRRTCTVGPSQVGGARTHAPFAATLPSWPGVLFLHGQVWARPLSSL